MQSSAIRFWIALAIFPFCCAAQTGTAVPGMAQLDSVMTRALAGSAVPGAALAVAKDGHLVYARGFGLADVDAIQPVLPDSLFRLASVSKTFTAAGILKLVEEGKLDLDAKAFDILSDLQPPPGRSMDPRIGQITVRLLLRHAAGWDSSISGDVVLEPPYPDLAAQALGVPSPPEPETIIRYMLGRPLDFDPGSKAVYSNFGYCVLGRIIERITGQRYETYIRNNVLGPAGISRMFLARSLPEERAEGEVRYYTWPGDPMMPSAYPDRPGMVPAQYGAAYPEPLDSGEGWAASVIDLVRFAVALDAPGSPLLKPESMLLLKQMPDDARQMIDANVWYGLGWVAWQNGNDVGLNKSGHLPGTLCHVLKVDGLTYAVVFNSGSIFENGDSFLDDTVALIETALGSIRQWPDGDQFPLYYGDTPRIAATGVQNAASFTSGAVASGEKIMLSGSHLGAAAGEAADVRVLFDGAPAPVLCIAEHQITAVVPASVTGGRTRIEVEKGGVRTDPVDMAVADAAPGIDTVNHTGRGQAAALNEDGSANSPDNPARKGSTITVFATGLGTAASVTVTLGSSRITEVEAGALDAGATRLRLRIPADAPAGAQVPVFITCAGAKSRLGVTLTVE